MRLTIEVARRIGRLALNPAVDGLGDPLALLRGPSSEVNPEPSSTSKSTTTLGDATCQSSRSSALRRLVRLA
jgi:hypothetical protein